MLHVAYLSRTAKFNPYSSVEFYVFRLSVNFASVIYCYGIKEGGLDAWTFAYEKLVRSNSAAERDSLMAVLGCSNENWILHR